MKRTKADTHGEENPACPLPLALCQVTFWTWPCAYLKRGYKERTDLRKDGGVNNTIANKGIQGIVST